MPRTRVARKKEPPLSAEVQRAVKRIEAQRDACMQEFHQMSEELVHAFEVYNRETMLLIPEAILDKTIGELDKELGYDLTWTDNKIVSHSLKATDMTRSVRGENRTHLLQRSASFTDEGYLTTESAHGNSGRTTRTSRAKARVVPLSSRRMSRSVSVKKTINVTKVNKFKTPANIHGPASYGLVTPKVAPGMPQVLLRHPKQGEVVLSLQGSPLMTGTVISGDSANINIPMEDGRLLSIQAKRGLRVSEIPSFDEATKRQLETLRDNLNKVVAASKNKQ